MDTARLTSGAPCPLCAEIQAEAEISRQAAPSRWGLGDPAAALLFPVEEWALTPRSAGELSAGSAHAAPIHGCWHRTPPH